MPKSKKPEEKKLTEEELKNLTGYFDVLIQMDLEQKRKVKLEEDEKSETGSNL